MEENLDGDTSAIQGKQPITLNEAQETVSVWSGLEWGNKQGLQLSAIKDWDSPWPCVSLGKWKA